MLGSVSKHGSSARLVSNKTKSLVSITGGDAEPGLAGVHSPATGMSKMPADVGPDLPNVLRKTSGPASLFDGLGSSLIPVVTNVEVQATPEEADTSRPQPYVIGGAEVINSAGTYGDISRFLQVIPGVVPTSDMTNDFLVRGGHPMENLFLVDDIEVPNINQVATLGTTGGFAPMIDSGLVQSLKIYTGGYDATFPERLSSVTDIRTLDSSNSNGHLEGDVGIEGVGHVSCLPTGRAGRGPVGTSSRLP